MKMLNAKEQAVFDYICQVIQEKGYAPSVRDIGTALGYKSTSTVQMYLDRLLSYGVLHRESGKSRSLRVDAIGNPAGGTFVARSIPVLASARLPKNLSEESCRRELLDFAYCGTRYTGELLAVSCEGNKLGIPTHATAVFCLGELAEPGELRVVADGNGCLRITDEKETLEEFELVGRVCAIVL